MQHSDQHKEAVEGSVRAERQVSCALFDDKVKDMGSVTVRKGKIVIDLDYVPHQGDHTGQFLADEIALAIRVCYAVDPDVFDPLI